LTKILPLGGTALGVIDISSRPVLVVKPFEYEKGAFEVRPRENLAAEDLFKKVMVAVDYNVSDQMLEYVARLYKRAKKYMEQLYIIHIIEPMEGEANAKRLFNNVTNKLYQMGVSKEKTQVILLESAKPSREILSVADQLDVSCIIAGRTHKERKFVRQVLGGTLLKLLTDTEIPLLVYPLI
jgi:nucleotide-binding universal stress UspA family protein